MYSIAELKKRAEESIRRYQEIPPTCHESRVDLWWAKRTLTYCEAVLKLSRSYPDDLPYPGGLENEIRRQRVQEVQERYG